MQRYRSKTGIVTFCPFQKVDEVSKGHSPQGWTEERYEMSRQKGPSGVIPASLQGVEANDAATSAGDFERYSWLPMRPEGQVFDARSPNVVQVVRDIRQVIIAVSKNIETMRPERVKSIREGLGLTQVDLGTLLRLGPNGKRTVIRWEQGDTPVPGPVSVALEALEAGWAPGTDTWAPPPNVLQTLHDLESAVLQAQEHVRNIRRTHGVGE